MAAIYGHIAPPRAIFTTSPYPVEAVDAFNVFGQLSAAVLLPIPIENYSMTLAMRSGTLETLLKQHEQEQPEVYEMSMAMHPGELITILEYHEQDDPENYEMTLGMLDGTLNSILVTVEIAPDAFDVTGSLTHGALDAI